MKTELKIENIGKNQIAILGFQTNLESNTFDLESLSKFIQLLKNISNDNDAFILYSLDEKFFSNGLNLNFFQKSTQATKKNLLQLMVKCFRLLFSLKKFWISEINGHCIAGGSVIALASDYRYMVLNSGRIAFSEIPSANFFFPQSYIEGLKTTVQPNSIKKIVEGHFFKPQLAQEIGLIDETFESYGQLRKFSLNKIKNILKLDKNAFLTSRNSLRLSVIEKIKKTETLDYQSIEKFI